MKTLLAILQVLPAVMEFWAKLAAAQRRAKFTEAHREVDEDLARYLESRYGGVRVVGGQDAEGDVPGEDAGGDADH